MVLIRELLQEKLLPDSPTARLDLELILGKALQRPRSYLHTWPEYALTEAEQERFQEMLFRRQQGEPVAYILGRQGFWSLDLAVNTQTLIPRPETELLVETALALAPDRPLRVLDLGTGTGAVALALAKERPAWLVTAVDRVPEAVMLAENNRDELQLFNVDILQSDWFSALGNASFHLVIGNPPYIAMGDFHLENGDVQFEPQTALVSGEDGLKDIRHIVEESPRYLESDGWLMLEHGFDQGEAVRRLFTARGFSHVETCADLAGHERITLGQWI